MFFFCGTVHICEIFKNNVHCALPPNEESHPIIDRKIIHLCPFGCEYYSNGLIIKNGKNERPIQDSDASG